MLRDRVPVVLVLALLAGVPLPVRAGALGEVIGGLMQVAGDKAVPASDGSATSSAGEIAEGVARGVAEALLGPSRTSGTVDAVVYVPPPTGAVATDVYLYAGAQSVHDSDGSFSLELRATYDDFGLGVRNTSYFERVAAEDDVPYLHLDLWGVLGHFRALHEPEKRLEVWLEGGFAGVSTMQSLTLYGAQGGARVHKGLGGELGVSAEGRGYLLQEGVRAHELRSTFQVSILRISYRYVYFNVGPPLMGPEVGVGFTF